jgi:hypothetical protein
MGRRSESGTERVRGGPSDGRAEAGGQKRWEDLSPGRRVVSLEGEQSDGWGWFRE